MAKAFAFLECHTGPGKADGNRDTRDNPMMLSLKI